MKNTRLILGVLSILVVLAFTASYAEEEKAYVPKDNEELYGTWFNTEYGRLHSHPQKTICYSDGKYEAFLKESDTYPSGKGTITIIDKWTDSEGNIWYKTYWKGALLSRQLDKISNSGTIWEARYSPVDYPTEMDPNHPKYRIYYRK